MKEQKHYRAYFGPLLGIVLVWLIYGIIQGKLSTMQIGCWVVMFLAGGALLVNNQRNESFHDAVGIPLLAALSVYIWTSANPSLIGRIFCLPLILYFAWLAAKPYIERKKSRSDAKNPCETPVELEGNSKG